jgi:alkanesulfonate monooxygenase SsuD/methylene tetrahydromethanopterin reductase-like flavin-dependent oxidoreductase (luciferase family)
MELVANYTSLGTDPRDFARSAEEAGFHGVSCSDHFFRTTGYPHLWVTLSAMAAVTEDLILGSSFANNLFRSPVEFVQASLTMQWLSRGRFEAGLGAGWLEVEATGSGLAYPPARERARRYREAMVIARDLLTTGRCQFAGEHYTIDVPVIGPDCEKPPPLVASVGGPWTIDNVSPLADRVELKFGRTTNGGSLDHTALASATRDELASMVAQVRAVAPDVPIGLFTMIGVGSPSETADMRSTLGDGLYGSFVGEREQVLENLRSLDDLGITRIQVSELMKGSIARLGTVS